VFGEYPGFPGTFLPAGESGLGFDLEDSKGADNELSGGGDGRGAIMYSNCRKGAALYPSFETVVGEL